MTKRVHLWCLYPHDKDSLFDKLLGYPVKVPSVKIRKLGYGKEFKGLFIEWAFEHFEWKHPTPMNKILADNRMPHPLYPDIYVDPINGFPKDKDAYPLSIPVLDLPLYKHLDRELKTRSHKLFILDCFSFLRRNPEREAKIPLAVRTQFVCDANETWLYLEAALFTLQSTNRYQVQEYVRGTVSWLKGHIVTIAFPVSGTNFGFGWDLETLSAITGMPAPLVGLLQVGAVTPLSSGQGTVTLSTSDAVTEYDEEPNDVKKYKPQAKWFNLCIHFAKAKTMIHARLAVDGTQQRKFTRNKSQLDCEYIESTGEKADPEGIPSKASCGIL